MPGLRHAHTLQQLKIVIEYSPPGEYLNNNNKEKINNKKTKDKQKNNNTRKDNIHLKERHILSSLSCCSV